MKLIWYGNASVYIESNNCSLMFDPYLKDLPDSYEPEKLYEKRRNAFEKCKDIVITHGHLDHLSSIYELYKSSDAKIFLSKTPYNTLSSKGFDKNRLVEITPGSTINIGDFSIQILQGKHVRYDLKLLLSIIFSKRTFHMRHEFIELLKKHLQYPENNETLFFEILCEEKRIQVMGSAGLDKNTTYPQNADLLILPNQGRSDINSYNIPITKVLMPKRVLIDHWDDSFPPLSYNIDCTEYIQLLKTNCPQIKSEILREGKEIWI